MFKSVACWQFNTGIELRFHPGLVDYVTEKIGIDYLVNAGGAVHGHPGGSLSGAKAMRQAIDKTYLDEYNDAIAKWGKR